MALAIIFDSVGIGEWFVLLAVLLIVVGPQRLPATARKFGQYYSRFRRAAESFKRQLMDMDNEFVQTVKEVKNDIEESVADFDHEMSEALEEVESPLEEVPAVSENESQAGEQPAVSGDGDKAVKEP